MKTRLLRGASDCGDNNVVGNLAGLGAGATAIISFDLGTDWDQFEQVDVMLSIMGPSSGANAVQLFGSEAQGDVVLGPTRAKRLGYQYNTAPSGVNSAVTVAGGAQNIFVRPWGRYLVMSLVNADGSNAFGAASFAAFIAFPRSSTTQ